MRVFFVGVGEACDPQQPNTSILIQTTVDKRQVLLDCGFTTPHIYFRSVAEPDTLDALWVSHFHGDHFFGIPLLLLRLSEMGRQKTLTVLGQTGLRKKILQALDLAYPGFAGRLGFSLQFLEVEPGNPVNAAGVTWRSAVAEHPERCLALRLDAGGKSLFYSGDGRPTNDTLRLAAGCDLVIHEAYRVDDQVPGHGNMSGAVDFARRAAAARLALVHIEWHERETRQEEIKKIMSGLGDLNAFLPESGDQFIL